MCGIAGYLTTQVRTQRRHNKTINTHTLSDIIHNERHKHSTNPTWCCFMFIGSNIFIIDSVIRSAKTFFIFAKIYCSLLLTFGIQFKEASKSLPSFFFFSFHFFFPSLISLGKSIYISKKRIMDSVCRFREE